MWKNLVEFNNNLQKELHIKIVKIKETRTLALIRVLIFAASISGVFRQWF